MKKILSLAVVCCLVLVGIVFSSCKKEQKSSYPYTVQLAAVEQDQALCGEFELHGLPIIIEEMQKVSDQAGSIIFKDTRAIKIANALCGIKAFTYAYLELNKIANILIAYYLISKEYELELQARRADYRNKTQAEIDEYAAFLSKLILAMVMGGDMNKKTEVLDRLPSVR